MLNVPLQVLIVMLAGWVNERHRAVNAYLREENRVLRELHGKKPSRPDRSLSPPRWLAGPPSRLTCRLDTSAPSDQNYLNQRVSAGR